jgi:hypothetical protein
MSPHLITVIVAATIAAKKRANPRRRAVASVHGVGYFDWLRRWIRSRRRRGNR